ncbi:cache domain-containing sensor histidine kinase [Paenibacillus rigui]|nr:sensor histidine kinase [Paenibacillus rigui]
MPSSRAKRSIHSRLVLLVALFIVLPFALIGLLGYERSTTAIEHNAIQYSDQLVRQINSQLDAYFTTLQQTTYPLLIDPSIQEFVKLTPDEQYQRIVLNRVIQDDLFTNIVFGRPDIYSISILTEQGIGISKNASIEAKEMYPVYSESMQGATYKILGVSLQNSVPVLNVVRRFSDTRTYQSNALLLIQLRMNELIRIIEKVKLGTSGFVWIMDENGRTVYHPDPQKWGSVEYPDLLDKLKHGNSGWFTTAGKRLVIYHQSDLTHWVMVSEVPISELTGNIIGLRNVTLWLGSVLIAFILLLLVGFSLKLTRSLTSLQRLMRRAENGDLNVRAPENGLEEIVELNRSFNNMVSEINRLLGEVQSSKLKEQEMQLRQKDSELEALHSQINPHFLYNTLEIINSHAILADMPMISRIATSLADLFRYSVGSPREQVSLLEELTHSRRYLDIQSERFPSMTIGIQCAEHQLSQVRSVRLVIQPVVENAFKHGYQQHKMRPEFIGIHGEERNGRYVLTIEDRGKGMPPAVMERYNAAFAKDEPPADRPDERMPSIGLWNVHQRLRLTFGKPYGLTIRKSDLSGTRVEIWLPYAEQGGPHDV